MGMYDEFIGKCPHCGEDFYSQTKLTDCEMDEFEVGSEIKLGDLHFTLKDPCRHCAGYVSVVIKDGRVERFSTEKGSFKEGPWGSVQGAG